MKTYTYIITLRCFDQELKESMTQVTHWSKYPVFRQLSWTKAYIKSEDLKGAFIMNVEYIGMRAR